MTATNATSTTSTYSQCSHANAVTYESGYTSCHDCGGLWTPGRRPAAHIAVISQAEKDRPGLPLCSYQGCGQVRFHPIHL